MPDAEPSDLEIGKGGSDDSCTFTLHNEDHTLGNTLRYVLNKNPNVSFVGYSVPHPSEPKMNLRLQTIGPPATAVLHASLSNLFELGAHVHDTFQSAVAAHRRQAHDKDATQ
eukprot:CAMPEP_0119331158 /NCGR_PEP_ID=MMETSP1333-20130426/79931_1 /TAXON_ID=418940 /ORGANISM="Scyphosphaera apsteinii, Strain RCC1455" /LENGTH=111 /DNA_ID=CAMNT_0007340685 /DNA_START=23 /DNA_END=358 /DNA_ORIENTATION=+